MQGERRNNRLVSTTFEWLEKEINEVNTRKFFDIDKSASYNFRKKIESLELPIPNSYKAFVLKFGNAKLYKQHIGYALGVRAIPSKAVSKDGEQLLCFGYFQNYQACFKVSLLKEGEESPVFESQKNGRLKRIADDFSQWLKIRANVIHKEIGAKRWSQIVRGPSPFTKREKEIVEIRRLYSWEIIRIDENGDVFFKVHNGSTTKLPFYSIGVRDKKGGLTGKAWLPVSHIEPGSTEIIKDECYKKYIDRDNLDIYDLPDPEPEDKEDYWEFKN